MEERQGVKAILYPRVSDPRQVDNTSLEFQTDQCRRWCDANGYETVKVFLEEGRSAKATEHRKTLREALEFIRQQKGAIDAFVVYRIDRFTRQTRDFLALRDTLTILGCRMISVTEPLDDSPAGRMMGTFLAGIAQFDNEVRAERSRAGMKALAEQGCWVWVPPLGYATGRTAAGKPLIVPDADTAPIVRSALQMFASGGYTQEYLRQMVNHSGLRSRYGKAISRQSFRQLVENPVYAGWIVSKLTGPKPVRGNWEPLIDQATFDMIQGLLGKSTQEGRKHIQDRAEFVLKGFVDCESCGKPLTASWSRGRSKRYPYYHCKSCRHQSAPMRVLDAEFEEMLELCRVSDGFVRMFRKIVLDDLKSEIQEADSRRRTKAKSKAGLQRKKERLLDLLMSGTIDDATYRERQKKLQVDLSLVLMDEREAETEFDVIGRISTYAATESSIVSAPSTSAGRALPR